MPWDQWEQHVIHQGVPFAPLMYQHSTHMRTKITQAIKLSVYRRSANLVVVLRHVVTPRIHSTCWRRTQRRAHDADITRSSIKQQTTAARIGSWFAGEQRQSTQHNMGDTISGRIYGLQERLRTAARARFINKTLLGQGRLIDGQL